MLIGWKLGQTEDNENVEERKSHEVLVGKKMEDFVFVLMMGEKIVVGGREKR